MKQGTWITRIVILVLFLGVCAYLAFYVFAGMSDPFQTVVSYTYQMADGAALEGVVIRREEVIPGGTELVEVLPQEGEKVNVGARLAAVYQSEAALQNRREVKSLSLQLEQISYAMGRSDATGDVAELDNELVDTLARLRSGVSRSDLGSLEEDGLALRSIVLKRTGNIDTNAESLAVLQQTASAVEERLKTLTGQAREQTRYITAGKSGTFSGLADGYESVLTPEAAQTLRSWFLTKRWAAQTLTAAQLDKLMEQRSDPPAQALGKLITSSTWQFAAPVDDQTAQRLREGEQYTLAFSGDLREEVTMRLERLGEKEADGRRMAVFSAGRYMERLTLTRQTGATLIFEKFTGVRVPSRALRVQENEDGTTTLGVFVQVGRQAEFKPVEIVREGDGFYLLRGTATNRKVLRAGDLIILSNQELYNGKVVA